MTTVRSFDVAVLGCGLMGSAFARTFADAGLTVTVWNRSPARAHALAPYGIVPATSVEQAVSATGLVVVYMSNVDAALEVLGRSSGLAGRAVVNLSDGSPADIVRFAAWAAGEGIAFLDGSPFCYPEQVGTPDGMLAFSGPASLWSEHARTLALLGGRARWLSEEITSAKSLYIGTSSFFGTALAGFAESASYLLQSGRSLEEIRDATRHAVELLDQACEALADAIAHDQHETDQATIEVFADASRRSVAELRRVGVEASLATAVMRKLEAAEAAGLGHLGYSAQALLGPGS